MNRNLQQPKKKGLEVWKFGPEEEKEEREEGKKSM